MASRSSVTKEGSVAGKQTFHTIQDTISKWRSTTQQNKRLCEQVDKMRVELAEQQDNLRGVEESWKQSKDETQEAVTTATTEIQGSRKELETMESEIKQLARRTKERKTRNDEYICIINAKREALRKMRVEIEDKERDARQRLSNFRQGREEIRCQLAHNAQKLANTIPSEMEAHTSECDELRSRIADVEKARKDEARAWEDEKDLHQKEAKVFNLQCLRAEVAAAQRTKERVALMLREGSSLHGSFNQNMAEIAHLRQSLAITA